MPSVHVDIRPNNETAARLLELAISEAVATHAPCAREDVDVTFGAGTNGDSVSSAAYFTVHTVETREGARDTWHTFRREQVLPALSGVDGFLEAVLVADGKNPDKHYVVTRWASREAFDNHFQGQVEAGLRGVSEQSLVARAQEVLAGPIVRLLG